jgi:predicted outer membrane repeat protein
MTTRLQSRSLVLPILGAVFLLILCGRAEAATFAVNTTSDTPLSGAMCTGSEPCSLRAAVQAADAAGGANTITVPAGTFTLTVPSTGANNPANGDLDIDQNSSATIQGAGAGATVINAAGIDRAFAVQEGSELRIAGMTIKGGNPAATSSGNQLGGAIYAAGKLDAGPDLVMTANEAAGGGAVFVGPASSATFDEVTVQKNKTYGEEGGGISVQTTGNVTLTSSVLTENEALGGESSYGGNLNVAGVNELQSTDTDYTDGIARYGAGVRIAYGLAGANFSGGSISGNQTLPSGRGAGLYTESPVSVSDITFDENFATERGGAIGTGSPLFLQISGSTFVDNSSQNSGAIDLASYEPQTQIVNSTFTGNSAVEGSSVIGAYYFIGKFDLVNSTVVGNLGTGPALGQFGIVEPYERGVVNSIVIDNTGGDCEVALPNDAGHNILGPTCAPEPPAEGDQVGVDPLLSPLANNGGPTETMATATTSPAIGAGDSAACPATDQRGVARTGGCDVGAFQRGVPTPEPPVPGTNPDSKPVDAGSTSTPGPAVVATSSPKYKFGIKKIVHVREGGTAKLRIRFNGPGLIQLSGKRVASVARRTKAGVAYLPITPNEATATLLAERGRVHVTVMVQFTPDAGVGRIKEKKVGVWLYG